MTRVELSDDLKHAKVTMHGLTSATGRLRKDVMDRIHLKEMPTLKLLYDEGLKAQMEVMALLEKDRIEKDRMGNSLQEKTAGTEPASSDEETPQG